MEVFTFIIMIGGVLLWLVQNLLFSYKSNGWDVIEFFVSCIPLVGICLEFATFAIRSFELDLEEYNDVLGCSLRNTKFNRMFFNHLNWKQYDKRNNHSNNN